MSLSEYLEGCDDTRMYASAPEQLLTAFGEPEMMDTSKDARLGRIFMNRTIRVYPVLPQFYGMEDAVERIVGLFRYAARRFEQPKPGSELWGASCAPAMLEIPASFSVLPRPCKHEISILNDKCPLQRCLAPGVSIRPPW